MCGFCDRGRAGATVRRMGNPPEKKAPDRVVSANQDAPFWRQRFHVEDDVSIFDSGARRADEGSFKAAFSSSAGGGNAQRTVWSTVDRARASHRFLLAHLTVLGGPDRGEPRSRAGTLKAGAQSPGRSSEGPRLLGLVHRGHSLAGAMDMYDEFGNYVGPELDSDSDGESGEDQDEVRAKRSFADSTAKAPDRFRIPERSRRPSTSFRAPRRSSRLLLLRHDLLTLPALLTALALRLSHVQR